MNEDEAQQPMHVPPSRGEYDRYLDWLREQEEAGLIRLGRMPDRLTVVEAANFLRVAEHHIWDAIARGQVAAVTEHGVVRVDTETLFDDLGIARRGALAQTTGERPGVRR